MSISNLWMIETNKFGRKNRMNSFSQVFFLTCSPVDFRLDTFQHNPDEPELGI